MKRWIILCWIPFSLFAEVQWSGQFHYREGEDVPKWENCLWLDYSFLKFYSCANGDESWKDYAMGVMLWDRLLLGAVKYQGIFTMVDSIGGASQGTFLNPSRLCLDRQQDNNQIRSMAYQAKHWSFSIKEDHQGKQYYFWGGVHQHQVLLSYRRNHWDVNFVDRPWYGKSQSPATGMYHLASLHQWDSLRIGAVASLTEYAMPGYSLTALFLWKIDTLGLCIFSEYPTSQFRNSKGWIQKTFQVLQTRISWEAWEYWIFRGSYGLECLRKEMEWRQKYSCAIKWRYGSRFYLKCKWKETLSQYRQYEAEALWNIASFKSYGSIYLNPCYEKWGWDLSVAIVRLHLSGNFGMDYTGLEQVVEWGLTLKYPSWKISFRWKEKHGCVMEYQWKIP